MCAHTLYIHCTVPNYVCNMSTLCLHTCVGLDTLCSNFPNYSSPLCSQIVPIILMKLAYYSQIKNCFLGKMLKTSFSIVNRHRNILKASFLLYCNVTETVI